MRENFDRMFNRRKLNPSFSGLCIEGEIVGACLVPFICGRTIIFRRRARGMVRAVLASVTENRASTIERTLLRVSVYSIFSMKTETLKGAPWSEKSFWPKPQTASVPAM